MRVMPVVAACLTAGGLLYEPSIPVTPLPPTEVVGQAVPEVRTFGELEVLQAPGEDRPKIIGTTAGGAVANYAEARREAQDRQAPLVVLVGQPDEAAWQVDEPNAVVCSVPVGPTFRSPGVFVYRWQGGELRRAAGEGMAGASNNCEGRACGVGLFRRR